MNESQTVSTSRRSVLAGAAGVAGALAAACGGAGGTADTAKNAKPVKLIWTIYNDPPYLDAQKQGAAKYTEKHPNVTFDLVSFDDNAKLITEWLAGAGSHIAMNYGTPLVESGRQGLVISLDKYLKTSAKDIPLDDFVSFQLEATQWPSVGRFGLPMYINAYTLFFNKSLFQKKGIAPPDNNWDWAKYADGLARVTDKDQGIYGGIITNTQLGMTKVHQNAAGWGGCSGSTTASGRSAAGASPARCLPGGLRTPWPCWPPASWPRLRPARAAWAPWLRASQRRRTTGTSPRCRRASSARRVRPSTRGPFPRSRRIRTRRGSS